MKKQLLTSLLSLTLFIASSSIFGQQQLLIQKVDTTYGAVTNLKISGSFAKISITNSPDSILALKGSLFANEKVANFSLTHKFSAGTLEVNINYPTNNWVSHSGELIITVPKGISIDIENTSGYIDVTATKELKINALTTSGKILISECKGDYALRSTSGDITATKCEGTLTITTNSGKIITRECNGESNLVNLSGETIIANHNGQIFTESTSGKINIESVIGNVTAKSASALIKLSKIQGTLMLKSFSGQINLFDIKGILISDSGAGDQVGAQIVLTGNSKFISTEGSIKMRLTNPTPDITFKLVSESGFIQARTLSKKKKLNSGKGAILVESFSITGGQVFN